MTAIPVPDASNKGCPSRLAGTTRRRDTSRISPSAHKGTIRCRTDWSGRFRRHVTHPRLSATIPTYSHPATESHRRTPKPSQLAANLSPRLFLGLPVGEKRGFPCFPCQPPTAPKMAICCRTGGNADQLGDIVAHVLHDLLDELDELTCQQSPCLRLRGHRRCSLRCGWNGASQPDFADLHFCNFRPNRVNRP